MEFDEVLRGRRSIRKFLDVPVEFDMIMEVIDAACQAPSAGNIQGWRFVLIHDRETKEKIAECCFEQYWMNEAPYFIVVCSKSDKYKDFYGDRGEHIYSHMDAAMAVQNLMLKAFELGLGTCFVGAFEEEKIQEIIAAPSEVRIEAIIPIGYPDEKPKIPEKEDLTNIIFFDEYDNRLQNYEAIMRDYALIREKKMKELKLKRESKKKKKEESSKSKLKIKDIIEKVKSMKLFSDKELDELEKEYE